MADRHGPFQSCHRRCADTVGAVFPVELESLSGQIGAKPSACIIADPSKRLAAGTNEHMGAGEGQRGGGGLGGAAGVLGTIVETILSYIPETVAPLLHPGILFVEIVLVNSIMWR